MEKPKNIDKITFENILDVSTSTEIQNTIRNIRNQKSIRKQMYTDHIISEEEHNKWLMHLAKTKEENAIFVIFYDGKTVGMVSLNNINRHQRTADWAFYISKKFSGKGIGSRVESQIIEFAFNEVGIEKLNCTVLETNPIVIRLHKKFGFKEEGILRKNVKKGKNRVDVYLLGMLKEEWSKK